MSDMLHLRIARGDTFNISATYQDDAGDPIDLTNWTVSFIARRERTTVLTVNGSGNSEGEISVNLTSANVETIKDCDNYKLRVNNSGSTNVSTILSGVLQVSR